MLEDFRLKVFLTVAEECSFTKAAAVLDISQPAVSQNISELERMTGVKLFDRLRGEVRLTDQGVVFKSHATSIANAYAQTNCLFTPMPQATVRIYASDEVYAYLSGALELFMSIHPEVRIEHSSSEACELSFVFRTAPKAMGGRNAAHNMISSMYLCCQPSEAFAQTELFKSLRGFLSDYLASFL